MYWREKRRTEKSRSKTLIQLRCIEGASCCCFVARRCILFDEVPLTIRMQVAAVSRTRRILGVLAIPQLGIKIVDRLTLSAT
jgi:hypothetical protein